MNNTINVYGAAWLHLTLCTESDIGTVQYHPGTLVPKLGNKFDVYNNLSDFTIRKDSTGLLLVQTKPLSSRTALYDYVAIPATSYYVESTWVDTDNTYYLYENPNFPIEPYNVISDLYLTTYSASYKLLHGNVGDHQAYTSTLKNKVVEINYINSSVLGDRYALLTSDTTFTTVDSKTYISNFWLLSADITESSQTTIYTIEFAKTPNSESNQSFLFIPDWNDHTAEKNPKDIKTFVYNSQVGISYFNPRNIYGSKYLYTSDLQSVSGNGSWIRNAAIALNNILNPENPIVFDSSEVIYPGMNPNVTPIVTSSSTSAYPIDGPSGSDYYKIYQRPVSAGTVLIPLITTLTDSELIGGVNYSISINEGSDLDVGTCASAQITFKTTSTALALNLTLIYSVQQLEQSVEQVGVFRILSLVKNGDIYSVTAYDLMDAFNVDIPIAGIVTSRYTVDYHMAYLCLYVGILYGNISDHCLYEGTANDPTFAYYWAEDTESVNARDILSYIAAIGGCIAMMDNSGRVTFKKYGTSASYALDNTKYQDFEFLVYDIPPIDRLYIENLATDTVYSSGTGNNAIYIMGNRAFNFTTIDGEPIPSEIQSAANKIYALMSAIPTYTQASIKTYRDFGINVGDCITVDEKTVIVMNKSWSSSNVTFSSKGNQLRNTLDLPTKEKNDLRTLESRVDKLADEISKPSYSDIVIGGPNNEYGVLDAYDNSDNNIGHWDNSGLTIDDVTISQSLYGGETLTEYLSHLSLEARFG